MAKLFYTLEEAAAKLGMNEDQMKELVSSGKLGEYRDRDRLMFKVDQVDLLAHSDEDSGGSSIPLAESGELGPISLASDSGSGMNLESPKEQTGISIFDVESTDEADPSAVTQVTETAPPELAMDAAGSGSGLMDLTREADDTSLGADLLEGVQKGEGSTAAETSAEEVAAEPGVLFETTAPEAEIVAGAGSPALAHVLAEPYDGGWSGITGGVALGMVAMLALTLTLIIFGLGGMTDSPLVRMISGNFWAFVGGGAAAVLLFAIVGWMVGRRE